MYVQPAVTGPAGSVNNMDGKLKSENVAPSSVNAESVFDQQP